MATKIEERLSKGYIHFSAILEMVGKPQEHVDETFVAFINQMKKSTKYEITSTIINEAIAVEDSESLFSSFAEIEVLVPNMGALFDFCFECMPASIEIIAPSELKLKPSQASAAVNDLIGRIHQLDLHAKQTTQQITVYSQNLRIMIENAIVLFLTHKPHTLEEISSAVGVTQEQLPVFMDDLIEKKRIVKDDDAYGVAGRSIIKRDSDKPATDKSVNSADSSLSISSKKDEVIAVDKNKQAKSKK